MYFIPLNSIIHKEKIAVKGKGYYFNSIVDPLRLGLKKFPQNLLYVTNVGTVVVPMLNYGIIIAL